MELNNGHKLQNGKYRIEKKIGQGGFGITYLARCYEKIQSAMGSTSGYYIIVIKEFFWSRYCSRDPDGHTVSISSTEGIALMSQFKKKLKKEGEIISKLSHPNIVGILDIFEENNTAYLVMQYVEGESLNEIIKKKGKIDETVALHYTTQICSALTKIHGKRILHLDIKPSNILIDEDNQVKLIDFGISKQYDETESETSNTPIGISAGYSPIEQYGTLKSFLPPTDIYAVGATLYKMLTGQTPIAATARSEFDLEPVRFYNPVVSKQTETVVAKAMNEKVRDRYLTAQEFLQALNTIKLAYVDKKEKDIQDDIPDENNIESNPDDTKIEKLPEKKEKPKPPAPSPVIPQISVPKRPEAPVKKVKKPKKTLHIDLNSLNRLKIILPAAAILVMLIVVILIVLNRNTASKPPNNVTRNVMTTVIEDSKMHEPAQSDQPTNTQVDKEQKERQERETAERLRQERETQAKLEAERQRKEKEEQDKRDAERLRQERETQAKLEAERQRKEKEEQAKREAELLRQAREAQAKLEAERQRKEKEEQAKLEAERQRKEKEEQAKLEAERQRKEKEEQDKKDAANFLQQANSTFNNSSLGTARLDQSFQLYMRAKEKGADVSAGYRNFMSVAQALIGGGAGFDNNVKKLLEYAQKLNNTREVRDLLEKYK